MVLCTLLGLCKVPRPFCHILTYEAVLQEAILLCARDVASGMAYLHSKGVVHADLKPANILLKSAHASADDPRGFTCKARSLRGSH